MKLTRMTQLDPIDPLPPLGRKIEPVKPPVPAPTETRLPSGVVVGPDGKMRTDLPLPSERPAHGGYPSGKPMPLPLNPASIPYVEPKLPPSSSLAVLQDIILPGDRMFIESQELMDKSGLPLFAREWPHGMEFLDGDLRQAWGYQPTKPTKVKQQCNFIPWECIERLERDGCVIWQKAAEIPGKTLVGRRCRLSAEGRRRIKPDGSLHGICKKYVDQDVLPGFVVEEINSTGVTFRSRERPSLVWILPENCVELDASTPTRLMPGLYKLTAKDSDTRYSWFDGTHFNGAWSTEERALDKKDFSKREGHEGVAGDCRWTRTFLHA